MDSENQKGLIGTILFHGFLFLCVFLMSFAEDMNGGGGDNGIGEALGGIEVSLGEPDLGGPDNVAGYSNEQAEATATEKPVEEETLTDDNSDAPVLPSKEAETKPVKPVVTAPKITPPVYKKTTPAPTPRKIESKGLYTKKGGSTGDGKNPGNEGRPDGSVFGDKDGGGGDGNDGTGPGTGKPGSGEGDGPNDGPGKGYGNGKLDLSGFKKDRDFNIETNRSGAGTVIVKLCVDKNGKIKTVTQTLGGTMTDKYFIDLAIKAVKENSYSPTTGSTAETTCGLVKFTFKAR